MLDDSKLAVLLRAEMKALIEQRQVLQGKIDAIDLLLGEALLETANALDSGAESAEVAPKKKRGRRTNAQILADRIAAEADAARELGALPSLPDGAEKHISSTDEDEEAAQ